MVILALFATVAAFITAVCVRDTHRFVIREYEVHTGKIDRDMTICLLADLHGKSYGRDNEELLRAIGDIKPDLVLSAGDLISAARDPGGKTAYSVARFLKALTKVAPVYLANGNHEYKLLLAPKRYRNLYTRYERALTGAGIRTLRNETADLPGNLAVSGLETAFAYYQKWRPAPMTDTYLQKHLGAPKKDRYRILLAHNPTYLRAYADWGADLILSGHYHGGIMRLPKLGGVISPMLTLFPRYDGGRYDEYGATMIVSRGLGTHTLHVRINNPGELAVIRLIKDK